MQFLGFQAGDSVPDAKTIRDFKKLLEKDDRQGAARQLFKRFAGLLEQQGMIAREGSIVDASFVDGSTPAQQSQRERTDQIR